MKSPFVNVILFSIFWAMQIFLSKLAFNAGAIPLPFTIQTSIFSLILLSIYVFAFKRKHFTGLTKDILIGLLIANAIHGGLGGFFSNAGISLTTAINAGFVIQFSTVTTILIAWLVLKEKLTRSKVITLIFIMVGTLLLITKGRLDLPHIGDIILLLACLSWSTGNVLVRKTLKNHPVDSDVVTFLRPLASLPVLFGFILLAPLYPSQTQQVFLTNYLDFSFLNYAFFCSLFVVLLWIFLNRSLKYASASYLSMMSAVTPVLVALLAIIFLNESLEWIQWLGVLLIAVSGVATHLLKIDKH